MAAKTFYYARVSSKNQNLQRQIDRFLAAGANERDIITEKERGNNFQNRPAYQAMKNYMLREGDCLVVCSIDRLGRNKNQIKQELEYFKAHSIRVKILDIPTTLTDFLNGQEWIQDMVNNILIEVLGSMAEQERTNLRERQKQGIESAKRSGKVRFGRPPAQKPPNWNQVYPRWKAGEITAVQAMKEMGLTKSTFYRLAKR